MVNTDKNMLEVSEKDTATELEEFNTFYTSRYFNQKLQGHRHHSGKQFR